MLTGSQVWYVTKIYPERVSTEESDQLPAWKELSLDDKDFWRAAARVLSDLSKSEEAVSDEERKRLSLGMSPGFLGKKI